MDVCFQVYDKLRKEQPDFVKKIVMIEADLAALNLALSPEDRLQLLDTDIIFHGAATVRFNESLRVAANINIRGTKQLLLLAREMPNLKAFVYISTAFSHCVRKFIEEKHYPPPLETDEILALLDILDDEKLQKITPILIDKWPNSYAYTKAIAESTVRQYNTEFPTCIVRPSIIASTFKEPLNGWINNLYGSIGVVMGSALGVLRTLHCVPDNLADIVPADYVIANIIAAGWDTAKRKDSLLSIEDTSPDVPESGRTPIYNYVSSCQNPITWRRFMKLNEYYGKQVPSTSILWYYMLFLNKYLFVHNVCVIFLHMIPAAIVDTLAFLSGRKPMLWKLYRKIHSFSFVISYFSSQQWQFRDDSVVKLWERLNPADRQIFNFDIQNIDWEEYIKHMIPGIRVYLINDPVDTIPTGKIKYRRLKIAHYTLLSIFAILLIWGIVSLLFRIAAFF